MLGIEGIDVGANKTKNDDNCPNRTRRGFNTICSTARLQHRILHVEANLAKTVCYVEQPR